MNLKTEWTCGNETIINSRCLKEQSPLFFSSVPPVDTVRQCFLISVHLPPASWRDSPSQTPCLSARRSSEGPRDDSRGFWTYPQFLQVCVRGREKKKTPRQTHRDHKRFCSSSSDKQRRLEEWVSVSLLSAESGVNIWRRWSSVTCLFWVKPERSSILWPFCPLFTTTTLTLLFLLLHRAMIKRLTFELVLQTCCLFFPPFFL